MATKTITTPAKMKISNTSATMSKTFVPYRENFNSTLAAGKSIEFEVERSGQVLYYLAQATEGLTVTQIENFDEASSNIIVIPTPATITLTNTSSTVSKTFVPYRENFTTSIPAGDSVVLSVKTVGQVLYYLAQATEGLTVAYAAVNNN